MTEYIHIFFCPRCNPQALNTPGKPKEKLYEVRTPRQWARKDGYQRGIIRDDVTLTREEKEKSLLPRDHYLDWPQHAQLDLYSRCQHYLRHKESVIAPPPPVGLSQELIGWEKLLGLVRRRAGQIKTDPKEGLKGGVILCGMFDCLTGLTHFERCNHKLGQGTIPDKLWNTIPVEVDPPRYSFGRNCAEVGCLHRAFEQRTPEQRGLGLAGCIFVSWDILRREQKPLCISCNKWLPRTGAIYQKPRK